MTRERVCLWIMLASFIGVVVAIAATYVMAPAAWTRILFAVCVLGWIVAAAVHYLGNRS